MHKPKLLVFDLDGTLLHSDKTVSVYTLDTLTRCKQAGFLTAIATARSEVAASRLIEQIQPDAVISNGGAMVRYGNVIVGLRLIPAEVTDEIIRDLISHPGYQMLTLETPKGYFTSYQPAATRDRDYAHAKYHDFSIPLGLPAYKVTVCFCNGVVPDFVLSIHPECTMTAFAGESWYRFADRDATKMNGVQLLATHLGLSVSEVAAFGDDYIDADMLQQCGVGVAVANAPAEIRSCADCVCFSNNDDGVAKWIEENLLI